MNKYQQELKEKGQGNSGKYPMSFDLLQTKMKTAHSEPSFASKAVSFAEMPSKLTFQAGKGATVRREILKVRARKKKIPATGGHGGEAMKIKPIANLPLSITEGGVLLGSGKKVCTELSSSGTQKEGNVSTALAEIMQGVEGDEEDFLEAEDSINTEAVSAEHHRLAQ